MKPLAKITERIAKALNNSIDLNPEFIFRFDMIEGVIKVYAYTDVGDTMEYPTYIVRVHRTKEG